MSGLTINHEACDRCGQCRDACPFGAVSIGARVDVDAACKLCGLCVKQCPRGAIVIEKKPAAVLDTTAWKGVLVCAEPFEGGIHPVILELVGAARELAAKLGQETCVIVAGHRLGETARRFLDFGADRVFVYDHPELEHFNAELHANACAACIAELKPGIVLVGATPAGRSLAPRLATRCRSGLTADCTVLDVKPNGDLVQIRPAFGGNIMAQIQTPHTRPQFATVRWKVMPPAAPVTAPHGRIEERRLPAEQLESRLRIRRVMPKAEAPGITEADVLVVAGRGVRSAADLDLLRELASLLGGQLATTRPLVEAGWSHHTRQIGLSGRTVKPKLIITCGVSGAVQFTASMRGAECIMAINQDPDAPIFNVAHHGLVGDLYEIVPRLIHRLKTEGALV